MDFGVDRTPAGGTEPARGLNGQNMLEWKRWI